MGAILATRTPVRRLANRSRVLICSRIGAVALAGVWRPDVDVDLGGKRRLAHTHRVAVKLLLRLNKATRLAQGARWELGRGVVGN